jgi:hypothetical protein
MFHSRIEARQSPGAWAYHPQHCGCTDCSIAHDPIGHRARRRAMTNWAVLFTALVVGFYGFALACAPQIAASFQVGR